MPHLKDGIITINALEVVDGENTTLDAEFRALKAVSPNTLIKSSTIRRAPLTKTSI